MNRRFLITRPVAQNASIVTALKNQGDLPVIFPLQTIFLYSNDNSLLQCERIKAGVMRLAEFRHIIFISTNAVQAACFWIDRYWPQLPHDQHYFAIGEATAAVMKTTFPFVQQAGSLMNSEALLTHEMLQQIEGDKVLIFRGKGGRDFLKQELERRGALVEYCEVYERQPVSYATGHLKHLYLQGLDILTATSEESIQLLLEHANNDGIKEELLRLPIIVPGKRLYDAALRQGFRTVSQAENASVKAMLKASD